MLEELNAIPVTDKSRKTQSDPDRIKRYLARLSYLEMERYRWDVNSFKDLSDFLLPQRGFFFLKGMRPNWGELRGQKIIDGTATRALRVLAAGMMSGLTSPSRPWFRLAIDNDQMMKQGPVKDWLEAVEGAIYEAFNKSNFYSSAHTAYQELAGFGTACLYEEEDAVKTLNFRVLTIGEYCIATNGKGRTDAVYRRIWMTAHQMADRFGEENLSIGARQALNDGRPDAWYQVIHVVQPREQFDSGKKDKKNLPFESAYFEYANEGKFLSDGGYEEFPYMCPRWDVDASDIYGRGPGQETLPDIKMLQTMQLKTLKALDKMVDPPMRVPSSYKAAPLRTFPGGINFIDSSDPSGIGPLYDVKFDVQDAEAKIARVQEAIKEGFYVTLFSSPEIPNMTATEVNTRQQEKLLQLGPVIERQITELLDPLIDRTFGILWRQGKLPMPPPQLQAGIPLKVEYISLLAQAQRAASTQGIQAVMAFVGQLAQVNPDVVDVVDFDEAVEQFGTMVGLPPNIIRTDDQVQLIRQQKAEQQAKMEQMQQEQAAVQGVKTLGQTPTDPSQPNALTDLMKQAQQMGGQQ